MYRDWREIIAEINGGKLHACHMIGIGYVLKGIVTGAIQTIVLRGNNLQREKNRICTFFSATVRHHWRSVHRARNRQWSGAGGVQEIQTKHQQARIERAESNALAQRSALACSRGTLQASLPLLLALGVHSKLTRRLVPFEQQYSESCARRCGFSKLKGVFEQ